MRILPNIYYISDLHNDVTNHIFLAISKNSRLPLNAVQPTTGAEIKSERQGGTMAAFNLQHIEGHHIAEGALSVTTAFPASLNNLQVTYH